MTEFGKNHVNEIEFIRNFLQRASYGQTSDLRGFGDRNRLLEGCISVRHGGGVDGDMNFSSLPLVRISATGVYVRSNAIRINDCVSMAI